MRMTKPAIVKKTSGAPITLLDLGLYAYVTGGAEKENPTFISSVGITAGLNNGFFSIAFGPSFVFSADKHNYYWGLVFTSDSLKF